MTGGISLLTKAEQAAESARVLLDLGDLEGATNRAYYATFHAARAALAAVGVVPDGIKTHSTVIGLFGRHLVQAGHLDATHGRLLNRCQQLRALADYDVTGLSSETVEAAVNGAAAFVAAVRSLSP